MKLRILIAATLCLRGIAYGLTPREVFSNSAVHLTITCGDSTGSGFILFRPADPSNDKVGKAFLTTNKHVLPPEGKECGFTMRAAITKSDAPAIKTVNIPVVGSNGKYLDSVRAHNDNDIAAINVTPEVASSGMLLEFVRTSLLGTKERLKNGAGRSGRRRDLHDRVPSGAIRQTERLPNMADRHHSDESIARIFVPGRHAEGLQVAPIH